MNNDTVVTKYWLAVMIECLNSMHDAGIQKVTAPGYESIHELASFAETFRQKKAIDEYQPAG